MVESTGDSFDIRISKRDVSGETLVCIDLDRNIWIKKGFPREKDTGIVTREIMINLSGPPYVFQARSMTFFDEKHPDGLELKDKWVIFMHGGRRTNTDKWMFSSFDDGYPVVETVRAVNQYLTKSGEGPIGVVMACNDYPESSLVKVGDFKPEERVVYAVGETVGLRSAFMTEDGEIQCSVKAENFWNLDETSIADQVHIIK